MKGKGGTLDANKIFDSHSDSADLVTEFIGAVAVPREGPWEEGRQATVPLHLLDESSHVRVLLVETPHEVTVQPGRPSRDCCDEDWRAWPSNPPRLRQRLHPVLLLVQVVERPQQQDRVNGPVRQIQPSSVHDGSVYAASVRCTAAQLLDVQRDEITEVNPITQVCKPQRVPPRATANVGDYCRGQRQMLGQQFRRPLELDYSERTVKPIDLTTQVVISPRVACRPVHHGGLPAAFGTVCAICYRSVRAVSGVGEGLGAYVLALRRTGEGT